MLIYLAWAILLVILSTGALEKVVEQIGSHYGGFIWTHDPTRDPPFYVSFDLWRSLPPIPTEIRFLDEIISIDGLSPWEFDRVYANADPGDPVFYLVRRGHQELAIQERMRVFTLDKFIISYGILYITGLSYILAGLALLHSTKRKDFQIFSFAFLFAGGAWLSHNGIWGVHTPYKEHALFNLILYTPAMPMVGALLLHFATLYPTPKRRILSRPLVPWIFYIPAIILIAGYTLTRTLTLAHWNRFFLVGMFAYAMLGMMVFVSINLMLYLSIKKSDDVSQRRILEPMLTASIVGVLIFIFLGMLPVLLLKYPLVPFEIWITLVMLIPPIMVYALRNGELIERLHQEASLREQYAVQVEELRNIRERTLHEVADALHDNIIPELRGLHLTAIAAKRQANAASQDALANELSFIAETLKSASVEARAIMEGAKPIDWQQTGLAQAILWLTDTFQHRNFRIEMAISVENYAEDDNMKVKESLYWITRAALSNIQDHARASQVDISLVSKNGSTMLRIVDNGVGFDPDTVRNHPTSSRRHLGLGNMRSRAAEIHARLRIESRKGYGTMIEVEAPHGASS